MADGWISFVLRNNIFHLISSNGFYGAENVLLEICLGLQTSSHFQPIVGLMDIGNQGYLPLQRECEKYGIRYIVFPCRGRYDIKLIGQLKEFIKKNDIKIVHSHGYKSNFYAFFLRSKTTFLVTTCHNWIISDFKMRCFVLLDKFLLRFFDRIICVSRPIQLELEKWKITKKLRLIYNGINLKRYQKNTQRRQEIRQRFGINEADLVIGFVGRVSLEKGIKLLLACCAEIHSAFPNAHIIIVGDGPLLPQLEREKSDYIHLTGVRTDVASFYSAFDLFILPSFTEGLPMVILEAMAAHLPVIASAVGAIPDVIEDGQTGYLIEPNNTGSLCHAIDHLLRCPELMRQMGERGLESVSQTFNCQKMILSYIAIYNSLLK